MGLRDAPVGPDIVTITDSPKYFAMTTGCLLCIRKWNPKPIATVQATILALSGTLLQVSAFLGFGKGHR